MQKEKETKKTSKNQFDDDVYKPYHKLSTYALAKSNTFIKSFHIEKKTATERIGMRKRILEGRVDYVDLLNGKKTPQKPSILLD